MSELVRTSSSRALSSGLAGRPKRSINCGGREEVGAVCDNRPSNPLLAATGSLLLIMRGKVLIASVFMISSSAKLSTSSSPPDHSASRSRSGRRRFFQGQRCRSRRNFMRFPPNERPCPVDTLDRQQFQCSVAFPPGRPVCVAVS